MLNEHGPYRGGLSAFLDFQPRWIIYKPLDKWFVPYRNFTLNWTLICPLHLFYARICYELVRLSTVSILKMDYAELGWWELFRMFNLHEPERLNWLSEWVQWESIFERIVTSRENRQNWGKQNTVNWIWIWTDG